MPMSLSLPEMQCSLPLIYRYLQFMASVKTTGIRLLSATNSFVVLFCNHAGGFEGETDFWLIKKFREYIFFGRIAVIHLKLVRISVNKSILPGNGERMN